MNLRDALRSPGWCEQHGVPDCTPAAAADGGADDDGDGGRSECDGDCAGDCTCTAARPNGGYPDIDVDADAGDGGGVFASNAPAAPMPFVLETRRRVIRLEERQTIMLKILVGGIVAILAAVLAGIIVQLFVAGTF